MPELLANLRPSPVLRRTVSRTVSSLRIVVPTMSFLILSALPGLGAEPDPAMPETPGSLVIVGGGGLPDTIRDRFYDLAGGKKAHIVVIPTASVRAEQPELLTSYALWRSMHVASVELLHTRDRDVANDPEFVKPLTEATAVWFTGGDQSRLLDTYHGTAVERELHQVLKRGGVIGGTSAGAAVMSPLMIRGGEKKADVGPGFGFLPGVIIDQHFLKRHRMTRLLGVLSEYPRYLGIGIDEQTAAVIKGRTLTVVGDSMVEVCMPRAGEQPPKLLQELKSGEQADLSTLVQTALRRTRGASDKEGTEDSARQRILSSP